VLPYLIAFLHRFWLNVFNITYFYIIIINIITIIIIINKSLKMNTTSLSNALYLLTSENDIFLNITEQILACIN